MHIYLYIYIYIHTEYFISTSSPLPETNKSSIEEPIQVTNILSTEAWTSFQVILQMASFPRPPTAPSGSLGRTSSGLSGAVHHGLPASRKHRSCSEQPLYLRRFTLSLSILLQNSRLPQTNPLLQGPVPKQRMPSSFKTPVAIPLLKLHFLKQTKPHFESLQYHKHPLIISPKSMQISTWTLTE